MQITVFNPSSQGAHFTENTNRVIICCFEWIQSHIDEKESYNAFRQGVVSTYPEVNDNNLRNIVPLLQHYGFVSYKQKGINENSKFFTNSGKSYVEVLKLQRTIQADPNYTAEQKERALKEANCISKELLCDGLKNALIDYKCKYRAPLALYMEALLEFGHMDKKEFAILMWGKNKDPNSPLDQIREQIRQYRDNTLEIEVSVDINNDKRIRAIQNSDRRIEGISYLTAFSFYSGLLEEAGLVFGDKKGTVFVQKDKRDTIEFLIKEVAQ